MYVMYDFWRTEIKLRLIKNYFFFITLSVRYIRLVYSLCAGLKEWVLQVVSDVVTINRQTMEQKRLYWITRIVKGCFQRTVYF